MAEFFEKHTATVLVVMLGICAILTLALVVLGVQLGKVRRRWRELLPGARGESLERLLLEQLRERTMLEERIVTLEELQSVMDRRMQSATRFRGYVRYDAFGDSGGEQSFSLAMMDEGGNGAVVTSLIGREGCHVYCKELFRGTSERNLTSEEKQAISNAQSKENGRR